MSRESSSGEQVRRGQELLVPIIERMLGQIGQDTGLQMYFREWGGPPPERVLNELLILEVNGRREWIEVPSEWLADYPTDLSDRPFTEDGIRRKLEKLAEEVHLR